MAATVGTEPVASPLTYSSCWRVRLLVHSSAHAEKQRLPSLITRSDPRPQSRREAVAAALWRRLKRRLSSADPESRWSAVHPLGPAEEDAA
jgi:hypothetical protein